MNLEQIIMKDLRMFEHRRGIAWRCSFYFEGRKVFNAENDGNGGMTHIDGIDAMLMFDLRKECDRLVGNPWGLEDIVDMTENEQSLADGYEELQRTTKQFLGAQK
jgi:hypothetical protein